MSDWMVALTQGLDLHPNGTACEAECSHKRRGEVDEHDVTWGHLCDDFALIARMRLEKRMPADHLETRIGTGGSLEEPAARCDG